MTHNCFIELTNTWAKFFGTHEATEIAREFLTYEDPSADFKRHYLGWANLKGEEVLIKKDGRFPSGLAWKLRQRIEEVLGKEAVFFEVVDSRRDAPSPSLNIPPCIGGKGYDFQIQAFRSALKYKRGLIRIPTGGGKGNIAAALFHALPGQGLFLVRNIDLISTFKQRWERLFPDEPVGIVGDGKWDTSHRITLATAQSLYAAINRSDRKAMDTLKWLADGVDTLLVDEVHELPANTMFDLCMHINARYRIGFSATPLDRGDKKSIYALGALGPIIYEITAKELIDLGVLAMPKVRMVSCQQDLQSSEWTHIESSLIVNSHKRNHLVAEVARVADKPGLVFVSKKKHGKILQAQLLHAGVKALYVDGSKNTEVRNEALKKLAYREIDTVISTSIFQQGVDVPELKSVVVACGGKSTIAALQRVGRGTRVVEGKTSVQIWDIYDEGNKAISTHSTLRLRAYRREQYETELLEFDEQGGLRKLARR